MPKANNRWHYIQSIRVNKGNKIMAREKLMYVLYVQTDFSSGMQDKKDHLIIALNAWYAHMYVRVPKADDK